MQAAACRPLLLCRSATIRSYQCRHIAGRRFPSIRTFHSSRPSLQTPPSEESGEPSSKWQQQSLQDSPKNGNKSLPEKHSHDTASSDNAETSETQEASEVFEDQDSANIAAPAQEASSVRASKGPYGSAKRRMRRNVAQKQESIVPAPAQFVANNIAFWKPSTEDETITKEINGGNASDGGKGDAYPDATVGGGAYLVHRHVLFEVHASVNAGLRPTWVGEADSVAAMKPHLVLQSPKDGGQAFLDAVVENAAHRCQADVIRLEAQDIAEYIADNDHLSSSTYTTGTLRTLGYDTHLAPFSEKATKDTFDDGHDEDAVADDEIVEPSSGAKFGKVPQKTPAYVSQPMIVSSISGDLGDVLKSLASFGGKGGTRMSKSDESHSDSMEGPKSGNSLVMKLVESLVTETETARYRAPNPTGQQPNEPLAEDLPEVRGIILHVKDYLEIYSTNAGNSLIRQLNEFVLRMRQSGRRILLLGTTSSEDLLPSSTSEGWKDIQNEASSGPFRTIIVPCTSSGLDDTLKRDGQARTREINTRHLQDMIRRLTFDPERTGTICRHGHMEFQTSVAFAAGLAEEVWSFEHVQRLAQTALGLVRSEEELTMDHLEWAINILHASDAAKSDWLGNEKKQIRNLRDAGTGSISEQKELQEERMKKLRKRCNTHEKRLLNGVVDVSGLKTTFADVRASSNTIDALRNLTSLSLTRPEAFTYGVLALEKIPGLLLYGPPGTGKTLLAKAVAKESGATILEISGADIYDMYVGEGEKNVRAIFSLARKISPCVVFIDEADALFGQRNNSGVRNTHREIINQFLREWDGMSENNTFIMVATNRPFDLDDAVLRRLPRRILVDLPTEKDREAILKIHLTGEQLDEDVSLAKLAQKTPFYSGSDLKNVCVAAALAAVREEMRIAAQRKSEGESSARSANDSQHPDTVAQRSKTSAEQPYDGASMAQYAERRTLRAEHFEKALGDISASISEDMSSLNAIRRFDEKYGDRSGKRRRPGGYGFGLLSEKEREKLESGRVRTG